MNASAIISLCSLCLALIVFLSNRNKDSNASAARELYKALGGAL